MPDSPTGSPANGAAPRPGAEGNTRSYHPAHNSTLGGKSAVSRCQLPPGLANHARYQVLELIGAGGMGCVYKARHLFMDRLVALKVINPNLLDRPGMAARFLQEVRAAARLMHPNIVQAYDADQVGDAHFLVMEYVQGVNLDQVVTEQGWLPIAQACDYAWQAAAGLQHAHEHGMVHRDVKPHNLMRTAENRIKILDFGLARFVSEVTAPALTASAAEEPFGPQGVDEPISGAETRFGRSLRDLASTYPGVGTPDYMAPEEILDARQADIRADIYSLGCSLYRFLTGRVPFPDGTPEDKLRAHLLCTPEPLVRLRPEVPPELDRVLKRMMAREPGQRYQTPAEAAQALAPFTGTGRRHILIVDDDPDVRLAVAAGLERESCLVACAANGQEALDRLQESPLPDLILLDMVMPVMDGWQFLHELKRRPELANIPVVVLSAAERGRAAALGMVDFLQKPVPIEEVMRKVKWRTELKESGSEGA